MALVCRPRATSRVTSRSPCRSATRRPLSQPTGGVLDRSAHGRAPGIAPDGESGCESRHLEGLSAAGPATYRRCMFIKRILIATPVTLVVVGIAAAEAFAGVDAQHAQLLGRLPR